MGRAIILALGGLSITLLAATGQLPTRLVYNASNSVPRGFYIVLIPQPVRQGDLVLLALPSDWQAWAAERGYLGSATPLIKRVAAVGGDHVCARADGIFINGRRRVDVLRKDSRGRPLLSWRGCRTLTTDEFLALAAEDRASFDGRYIGPLGTKLILGRLRFLSCPWCGG